MFYTLKSKEILKMAKRVKKTKRSVPQNHLTALEMQNVSSELIQDISYFDGDLFVNMRNGAKYRYPNMNSETVQEFLTAESFGRYFNENIRYRDYERLD